MENAVTDIHDVLAHLKKSRFPVFPDDIPANISAREAVEMYGIIKGEDWGKILFLQGTFLLVALP